MGRRALPKINADVDLSKWLHHVSELPDDFELQSLFENAAPLEIEVGSGKGLFLTNASQSRRETNFLGCEIRKKYAEYCAIKLAQNGCHNGQMLLGDALDLLHRIVRDESIAAVHVYFPDPWWKTRHRRRRIMTSAFVADLVRVLQPEGQFHFWTDVKEYFEVTVEQLAEETELSAPQPVAVSAATHDMDYRTHFERRMRKHDHPVYRALFNKSK